MKKYNALPEEVIDDRKMRNRSIIAFIIFLLLVCLALLGWKWINHQPREDGALKPLRKTLEINENFFSSIYDSTRLVKEYPLNYAVKRVRVNGGEGMSGKVDIESWKLQVVKSIGDTLKITLDDIKRLPKKDIVFNFKCIEGWSQITHWAGVPLKTFMQHYHLNTKAKYVGLLTPDKGYYVGIDMPSALHPQTLLCYEMNGQPLPNNQGFPLRLIIPVKYGIKHLKRIGTIFFSDKKPPDFWAERGYDYYAGH
jgi:hypothetical protein